MQAIEEVTCPTIQKMIGVYASKLCHLYPRTMDYDDAKQTFIIHLIKSIAENYDASKSNIHTFAEVVVRSYWNSFRYHRYKWRYDSHESVMTATDLECPIEVFEGVLYRWEELSVLRVALDKVEEDLKSEPEICQRVFRLMRDGMNQTQCATALGVAQSYVSNIVTKRIKKVVIKRCA